MNSMYSVNGPPSQLVDWLHKPTRAQLRHSIVIGSRCNADLPTIGDHIANSLNEQAPKDQRQWHSFCMTDLWRFAGNPAYRETILENLPPDRHDGPPDSDIDRIARRLARVGGAILEGQYSLDATDHLDNTFRVCLCSKEHRCPEECNILLNPENYESRRSLASTIASAFISWEPNHPVSKDFKHSS